MAVAVHDRRPPRPHGTAVRNGLDEHVWRLMQQCWQTDPANRPDMTRVALQFEVLLISRRKSLVDTERHARLWAANRIQ